MRNPGDGPPEIKCYYYFIDPKFFWISSPDQIPIQINSL